MDPFYREQCLYGRCPNRALLVKPANRIGVFIQKNTNITKSNPWPSVGVASFVCICILFVSRISVYLYHSQSQRTKETVESHDYSNNHRHCAIVVRYNSCCPGYNARNRMYGMIWAQHDPTRTGERLCCSYTVNNTTFIVFLVDISGPQKELIAYPRGTSRREMENGISCGSCCHHRMLIERTSLGLRCCGVAKPDRRMTNATKQDTAQ